MKENPSRYLSRHLKTERPLEKIPASLKEPLAKDLEFSLGGGTIEVERKGIKIHIEYGSLFSSEANHVVGVNRTPIKDWRTLEAFALTDPEGDEIINLTPMLKPRSDAELPETPRSVHRRVVTAVFPAIHTAGITEGGSQLTYNKDGTCNIILKENITSLGTILALLHEIGHKESFAGKEDSAEFKDYLRLRTYSSTLNKRLLTEEERNDPHLNEKIAEIIIREERAAWAYALNAVRPLIRLGLLEKSAVMTCIHSNALQSYSNFLQKGVNPNWRDKIAREIISWITTKWNIGP